MRNAESRERVKCGTFTQAEFRILHVRNFLHSAIRVLPVPLEDTTRELSNTNQTNDGLFVSLHFRSWERKVHRETFRSVEHSLLWNFRSSAANVPRSFAPWNFRFGGTFISSERILQELSLQSSKKQPKAVAIHLTVT